VVYVNKCGGFMKTMIWIALLGLVMGSGVVSGAQYQNLRATGNGE
jgi:hypothetical protein